MFLASEKGAGLSFRFADKFMAEFDYTRSDWRNTGLDTREGMKLSREGQPSIFGTSLSEAYRLGFEYVPNRSDIRYYYKKIAYRAGAYWKRDYFTVNSNPVNAYGITLGATLPVFRLYNGLTVGMDFGQRGTIRNDLVRETYFNFSIGLNIHDIWFVKNRYE